MTDDIKKIMKDYDVYKFENSFKKYEHIESICLRSSESKHPLFSVFIPTYKRPVTLKKTIESVLHQEDYAEKYEIIIVCNDPDGKKETNETYQLVKNYKNNNISYYVNNENLGLCGNWNRGTELAKGQYIVMIHDDDILGPFVLSTLSKTIKLFPNAGMFGCGSISFSDNVPVFSRPFEILSRKVTKKSLFFGKYIGIAGMTYKKDCIKNIGGFNEKFYPNEDTNLIYQMLINSSVISIENKLTGYRQENNLSLTPGILNQIVIHTELLRRNIAEYESFAKKWMKKFDKYYLLQYIKGAENYWKTKLEERKLLSQFGFNDEITENDFKYKLMLFFEKYNNFLCKKFNK